MIPEKNKTVNSTSLLATLSENKLIEKGDWFKGIRGAYCTWWSHGTINSEKFSFFKKNREAICLLHWEHHFHPYFHAPHQKWCFLICAGAGNAVWFTCCESFHCRLFCTVVFSSVIDWGPPWPYCLELLSSPLLRRLQLGISFSFLHFTGGWAFLFFSFSTDSQIKEWDRRLHFLYLCVVDKSFATSPSNSSA